MSCSSDSHQIVLGISGASGALYAQRLAQLLVASQVQLHLVVSPLGQRILHDELGMEGLDVGALVGDEALAQGPEPIVHNYRDVGAAIASGSFVHQGMVIAPCSANSLSAVAQGSAQNLLHRAAHVALKERRRLILVHREMPLSLVEIRNMEQVTLAGAVVMPANPGFYMLPQRVEDLVDFVVGRVLDQLGVGHELDIRWVGRAPRPRGSDRGGEGGGASGSSPNVAESAVSPSVGSRGEAAPASEAVAKRVKAEPER